MYTVSSADHANNLAGSIATAFCLLLLVTSMHWVRRMYFQVMIMSQFSYKGTETSVQVAMARSRPTAEKWSIDGEL